MGVTVRRYAEGPEVEVTVDVAAAPEALWPLVSDPSLLARWSEELEEAGWEGGAGAPVVGARIRGRSYHPAGGAWETTSTVVACDPPHRFGWAVGDPAGPSATWWFEVAADGAGSRLTQGARLGPGPSGLTPALVAMPDKELRIVERRLREHEANMRRTLAGIKALAEAGTPR